MFINDHLDLGADQRFHLPEHGFDLLMVGHHINEEVDTNLGMYTFVNLSLSLNCFAWTVQLEFQNKICETTKRKTYPSDMLFQDRPGTFEDGHVCCWEVEVVHVPRQLGILPCTDIWDTILSCTNTWVWLKFCIFSCLRFPIFLSVWVCDCFAYISSSPHISNKFVSVYSAIIIRWERGAFLSRTGIWCVTMIGRHNIGSKPLGSSEGYFVCFA